MDHEAGANVGVWAGRTTTVTQHAIAARAVPWAFPNEETRRWRARTPGWESRASCAAGPAGSRYACAIRAAENQAPGTLPPDALPAVYSAQLSLSTCWFAVRPLAMSSLISSAVSAYPVSALSRDFAKTTP